MSQVLPVLFPLPETGPHRHVVCDKYVDGGLRRGGASTTPPERRQGYVNVLESATMPAAGGTRPDGR